ncbi:uncharacterized protein BX664DRAFT_378256 [Halteromyces radiatus]|uniref:uncharacterized protein n=1 Tax=Halteromyces radiatus TaxID=101107 RepID=UPI00221E5C71|nr:uncharacterized protein BX664DRAFT_378256 [Halteromyces radiatus]KAI8097500.1 hypothetical protein BX664DRAFT_378256 [Halteromyces radiatus]
MISNNNKKYKRQALRKFSYEKRIQEQPLQWLCCATTFNDKATLGRHIHTQHAQDLLQLESQLSEAEQELDRLSNSPFTKRRAEKGTSDPIHVECNCDQSQHLVILFYQYVNIMDPEAVAKLHMEKCGTTGWNFTGKVRVAKEGMNVTLAGDLACVNAYMDWYTQDLQQFIGGEIGKTRDDFFKPSLGCRHVFSDQLSVKTVDEICPLRQSSITLQQLTQQEHQQRKLSPQAFHTLASTVNKEMVLLDTRNYYESKIGQFKHSITPPIRKFSVFPSYVDHHRQSLNGKTILTYCTGGIRCEKATAYLRQTLSPDTQIYMLDGGIHQYLNWVNQHPEVNSIWQGKNYVFDARQGVALNGGEIISECQVCHTPWDTYQKCQSEHCHLLILHCDSCRQNSGNISFCCDDCQFGKHLRVNGGDGICPCEKTRKSQELHPIPL